MADAVSIILSGVKKLNDAVAVKRAFIQSAMRRANQANYPVVEPTPGDNARELSWWIKVFDAKAFLFSENGSATWLFPHYELKLKPLDGRVIVSFEGTTIVDSTSCFEFHETAHPVQIYMPPSEVDFNYLVKSTTLTYCPFKNIAEYYSVRVDGNTVMDAFWSYENIYEKLPSSGNADGILEIKGMLSPDRRKLHVEIR
jgi:uncharacterized protein (DUF427 family)